MSRLKNFSRNLVTSYLQLGVNVVYSLVSIPLILHWLPKAEFGMWALLVQLMGYLGMVDLGMTSAVARLLVDHKDDRANGNYGSLLKTALLVSTVQGVIVLVVAMLAAPVLAALMKIPPEHQQLFIRLLRVQGLITAVNFGFRPLNMMLYAHQRMDLQTISDMTSLVVSLGLLGLLLLKGFGIYAFVCANAVTALWVPVYLFWNCRRLQLVPRTGEWGAVSAKLFHEVFNYGSKIFLFDLGCQLQFASQIIVVSRGLGLESAALWAVGTKMFNLVFSLVTRPYGATLPGLMEMLARGEVERLKARFRNIVVLTASLGAFLAGSYVLGNSLFVGCWTSGKISWPPLNDALLATWLFVLALQTTHNTFASVSKQFGALSYVFLAEGISFILLTLTVGRHGGMAGMVGCSIFCTLIFSYQYGIRRSCLYFQCTFTEIAWDWVLPSLRLAVIYGLLVPAVWFGTASLPALWRLIIHSLVIVTAGGMLFFRMGIPPEILEEALMRLPQSVSKWSRRFLRLK